MLELPTNPPPPKNEEGYTSLITWLNRESGQTAYCNHSIFQGKKYKKDFTKIIKCIISLFELWNESSASKKYSGTMWRKRMYVHINACPTKVLHFVCPLAVKSLSLQKHILYMHLFCNICLFPSFRPSTQPCIIENHKENDIFPWEFDPLLIRVITYVIIVWRVGSLVRESTVKPVLSGVLNTLNTCCCTRIDGITAGSFNAIDWCKTNGYVGRFGTQR